MQLVLLKMSLIKEMTGTTIHFLPDKTTVKKNAWLMSELGVLSDIQMVHI